MWVTIMKRSIKILFFASIIFIIIYLIAGKKFFHNDPGDDSRYLSLFSEAAVLVKNHYVEEVAPEIMFPGAFSAMVSGLDKYSSYLDIKKSQLYQLYQSGNFYSLGISGLKENQYFTIKDVLCHSPADEAGLEYGDVIKAVNGNSMYSLSFWEMFLSILSDRSVGMELKVRKSGSSEVQTFNLKTIFIPKKTRVIQLNSDIHLMELRRIDRAGVKYVKEAMKTSAGSKWVIDLRRYGWGDFESFLELTKVFVNRSVPLSVEARKGQVDFIVGSPAAPVYHCVFVINASTILYSELLAQVLKSINAVLVGQKTSGFTPRLKHIYLQDGSSVLLTDGIFKINGKRTLGCGIVPQFEIKRKDSNQLFSRCIALLEGK